MARSFLTFSSALATATLILIGAGARPASAQPVQPATPTTPSTAAKPKEYPEAKEALQLLLRDHNIPAAIKKLEKVSKENPELPSAHVLMYQILAQLNQPAAARAELDEAVKTNAGDPEPYIILGDIALQERRLVEAALSFDKAKAMLAKYTNAERKGALEQQTLSGMAVLAEARGDWKEAEARLRDLLKVAHGDLVTHERLARSLFWQGKAVDALAVLKKAKQIDRDNAKKYGAREVFLTPEAIMGQYSGQVEGPKSTSGNAERWFNAAVTIAPNDLPTRQIVAVWALEQGKLALAKEQAEAVLRIEAADPKKYGDSTVGHMLRGIVGLWEKDWPVAEKHFDKIVSAADVAAANNPASMNNFGARNNLALALVEQKNPAKKQLALDYAEANLRRNENNPEALSTLGWVHFRRNEFDQAKSALDRAIKTSEQAGQATGIKLDLDTATYMAHVLHHQGQKWQAKELLDKVLNADRPFSMRPEARKLYEKVKDAEEPEGTPGLKTP